MQSSTTANITIVYSYDNNGYLISETDNCGAVKTYGYNTVGWLESETDAENTVSYKYNLNGNTLRETVNYIYENGKLMQGDMRTVPVYLCKNTR